MSGATIQASLTFLISAVVAVYIAATSARSPLRAPLLGYLVAIMAWSAGVVWRFSAGSDDAAFLGYLVVFAGGTLLPVFWLVLAARYARVQIFEARPIIAYALAIPALTSTLALVTNSEHGLVLRAFSQFDVERGPIFFAQLAVSYSYVALGNYWFIQVGARSIFRASKAQGALFVGALILPLFAHNLFIWPGAALPYDPTPAALGFSILGLSITVLRHQLLDSLPLARRDLIDHLREGVLIADAKGILLDANPAAEAILACARVEIRGRRIGEVLCEVSDGRELVDTLQESFETLPPGSALIPAELMPGDGRRIQVTGKSIQLTGGGPVGRFVVLRDRTQEHQYEHFARQVQRLETVGALAAGVAHEVNNPLAFLRSNFYHLEQSVAQIAKHRHRLPEDEAAELDEMPEVVAECIDGIERIGKIVDSMRRFSRAPADDLGFVAINRVLEDAIRLSDLHRARQVSVRSKLASDLPEIYASAQRLNQVFVNLLVNAKQALADRPDAEIVVETKASGDGVLVEICDNGPGIPADVRHRVFDPFFTTKGPEDGTGLGLSIAFEIVREHGGILEVRDQGRGTCFAAKLPRRPDEAVFVADSVTRTP